MTRWGQERYTTPAMRIVTSLAIAVLVIAVPLTALAAPSFQAGVDPKSLALAETDLPAGFSTIPDRTISDERSDGIAVYDVTFARERTTENLAAGPIEVRSGVARTARSADAVEQLASTKEAFVAEGWAELPVPPLGDEALGLSLTTDGDQGSQVQIAYLFRKGPLVLMTAARGRPNVVTMNDVVGMAIVVSGRVDRALGGGQAAPAGSPVPGGTTTRSGATTSERVRVVNAEGGNVNVRSEPSTSAAVLTQVTEGTLLEIAGPDRQAEGRTWRNVRTSGGQSGWIASTLVETVATPAPSPTRPSASTPSPSDPRTSAPPSAGSSEGTAAPEDGSTPETGTGEGGASADGAPTDEGGAVPTAPAPAAPLAGTPVPAPPAAPSASPAATGPSATPAPTSGTTGRATGPNGLAVEVTLRDAALSSGKQQARVLVTRNGGPVENARVDVIARLSASRYRAINAPRTGSDGRSEVEWDMEGPAGAYEVVVDVRPTDTSPPTTAKATFRWK
ncbi:MAG: SH3 domain-containing protein [Chloroflexi bacterium]|nr:SH3 domain-containing protein [Chloroflexota bacterium]